MRATSTSLLTASICTLIIVLGGYATTTIGDTTTAIKNLKLNGSDAKNTKDLNPSFTFEFTGVTGTETDPIQIVLRDQSSGGETKDNIANTQRSFRIRVEQNKSYRLTVSYKNAIPAIFDFLTDATPPKILSTSPKVIYETDGNIRVKVEFDENIKTMDTAATSPPTAVKLITLAIENPATVFTSPVELGSREFTVANNSVEFSLGKLTRANYEIKFLAGKLGDAYDNAITGNLSQIFSVYAPPASIPPTLALESPASTLPDGSRVSRTNNLQFRVNGIPEREGTVQFLVDNVAQPVLDTRAISRPIILPVVLNTEGNHTIQVAYKDGQTGETKISSLFPVVLDTTGPDIERADVAAAPTSSGIGSQLVLTFADADVQSPVANEQFQVFRKTLAGVDEALPIASVTNVDGRVVRMTFAALPPGDYELRVLPTLLDRAGNPTGRKGNLNAAGKMLSVKFGVSGGQTFGQQVEFPPYAPPAAQRIPEEGFNPGDFVETRVARLYYYRDAHRVAQIINRNIRSFNQAAVTQAERRAENSRDDADSATDERRAAEREAIRAAEQARQKEQELAAARSAMAEAQQARSSVAVETATVEEISRRLKVETNPDQIKILNDQLELAMQRQALENANLQRFGGAEGIAALTKNVAALEQTVASYRQTELIREEASQVAAAKEERRRAQQFRDEVSAAETDPDTYVAGNINSVDPVSQVSISVIGEGLIELRGPIKGINKIRTLINQIDSPVGQIKIGIFTVQVNGEKGEKMEKCVGEAENHVDLSRFLVNQSLNTLRRCVQSEAALVAEQCAQDTGHYQVDRDRRYLYSFFGRDFIDELYAIDSEFLKTENTVLSLHAMDTISLNRALFILALAKNDIRERIVARFLEASKTSLPEAEFDFRRSSELKPHVTEKKIPVWNRSHLPVANHYKKEDLIFEAVQRNAMQRYHFRNFSSFFDVGFVSPDTMNPMQREFIRLAQIFKARLIAEMEWKQRVLERGLIEDRSNVEKLRFELLQPIQRESIELEAQIQRERIANASDGAATLAFIQQSIQAISQEHQNLTNANSKWTRSKQSRTDIFEGDSIAPGYATTAQRSISEDGEWIKLLEMVENSSWATETVRTLSSDLRNELLTTQGYWIDLLQAKSEIEVKRAITNAGNNMLGGVEEKYFKLDAALRSLFATWQAVAKNFSNYQFQAESNHRKISEVTELYYQIRNRLVTVSSACVVPQILQYLDAHYNGFLREGSASARLESVRKLEKETRVDLDHRKLLNHLIDDQEEKFIELVEGTRSHIAVLDDYLKRLSIALEDDFKIQFYDPAFVRVRESARARQVVLSQVERTTILTNNRDFAKVDPQATMEFDLPKRQIAIKEAFDAARALVEDSGALMNDPTFLAAFQMMGGGAQAQTMKSLLPTQSSVNEQRDLGVANPLRPTGVPGSALQSLVPEPSIFKLETGTGFQIRPVMQPDGDSVVYDFDYMYTTNIREPVRADEKHIGRVKRHFVHTAVQTGNFEIREVSRYQVALKVARTSQGVPLLQDIPVVGAAFRPAPSDESSIQQNIIFGQTNVYPTLYDLMGLRWAQQVVDLDHSSLLEAEHVIRGRQKSMKNYVFGEASRRVDDFLDVQNKNPDLYRPDLYHPKSLTSPYHPDGFKHSPEIEDPTGNNYERMDRRPADMQEPPYERYRHRPAVPESIQLQSYEAPPTQAPSSRAQISSPSPVPMPPPSPNSSSILQTSAPVRRSGPQALQLPQGYPQQPKQKMVPNGNRRR